LLDSLLQERKMYKRKLTALGYHGADNFDPQSQTDYRSLVIWLEDQKVRHYKIEDRLGLRTIESDNWSKSFLKYLNDIGCPIISNTSEEILDWLVGFAVRLEFGDQAEEYRKFDSSFIKNCRADQPRLVSNNPLDNLDFSTPEFQAGVNNLADFLKIQKHPDHLITLQAICKFVAQRLNPKAIQSPESIVPEGQPFKFREHSLGFDTGDMVLNDAAKVLRLLYINDLRGLQTKVNEAIVAVQAVTANPKTDTRLGKVGR